MVSTSSQFIKRVEDAVFHSPNMIPNLFKDCKVKSGFVHSRLRRYVPHRVGIEFECFGDFANQYLIDTKRSWRNWEDFERYFNILDFSQDSSISRIGIASKIKESFIGNHEEIRVSIQDYRQLNGLYRIMNEMAKYCSISDDCGIHIHIDLTKYDLPCQKNAAVDWFNNHLYEVESIFPKYTGSYNKRLASQGKGSWINLSNKDTVEFRIAPLTFDYEVLITWIVKCSKLVSRMISECHLDRLGKKSQVKKIQLSDLSTSGNQIIEIDASQSDNLVDSYLTRVLTENHIEYFVRNGILVMDYPDGTRSEMDYRRALDLFMAGGLDSVIESARTVGTTHVNNHSTSTCYTTTRLSSDLIEVNNSVTGYYIHRIRYSDSDYYGFY